MTFQVNHERRKAVLDFYKQYFEEHGHTPSMQQCAKALDVHRAVVKHYVSVFEREGLMRVISRRVYLVLNGKVIDQRKAHNESTYQKKARAGREGAKRLREAAERNGISPSAFARIPAKDDEKIEERMALIVEKAKQNGTYCHPRPKVVYLIGQKAG